MKGLLLKDFYGLKAFGRTMLLVIGVYAVIAFATKDGGFLTSMVMVFCAMLPMTSVGVDEQAKWNGYAQCMPVSRRQVVLAKYVMLLILMVAGFALAMVVSVIIAVIGGGTMADSLVMGTLMFGAALSISALSLPILFKLGAEKSRMFIMLMFVLLVLPFVLLQVSVDTLANILRIAQYALPFVGLALLAGSYGVSAKIYEAKEF